MREESSVSGDGALAYARLMRSAWPYVVLGLCACAPAPATAIPRRPAAPVASAPTIPADDAVFTYSDDDVHVRVPIRLHDACVARGRTLLALPSCGDDDPKEGRSFAEGGGRLVLYDRQPPGGILFTAQFASGFYAVTDVRAARDGIASGLTSSLHVTPVFNPAKSGSTELPNGSWVLRLTFDVDLPRPGAFVHFTQVSLPGRRGMHTLGWAATRERVAEADAAITSAIGTIVYDAEEPPAPDIEAAIQRQRKSIHDCYVAGLADDPSITGTIQIRGEVRTDGTMARIKAEGRSGLPANVDECVLAQLRPIRVIRIPEPAEFGVPISLKVDPKRTTP